MLQNHLWLLILHTQSLHLCRKQALLKLGQRVKDEREVMHCDDSVHALLVDITRALKHAVADVEVCQRGPQAANLQNIYVSRHNEVQ